MKNKKTSVKLKKSIRAFTLAEVLITIGIIGIIAALTIPNLMGLYRKKVVETRLKKFYSAINQAILLSENVNGDKKSWILKGMSTDEFWNIYLEPYLNYTNVKDNKQDKTIYFEDGSAVIIDIYFAQNTNGDVTWQSAGGHFKFCPEAKYCDTQTPNRKTGVNIFTFAFWPNQEGGSFDYHKGKGVEPYMAWWDGKEESLYKNASLGCSNGNGFYCVAIIQHNGWKIPDDYPKKL